MAYPIIDESGKLWTASGTADLDLALFHLGNGSLKGGLANVSTPQHTDFILDPNNWTFEFFLYATAYTQYFSFDCGWNNYFRIQVGPDDTSYVGFIECTYYDDTQSWDFVIFNTILKDRWHHIEVSNNSGNGLIFLNGVLQTLDPSSVEPGATVPLQLDSPFRIYTNTTFHTDEFRYSNGITRHTSGFTPPISNYSMDAYTKSLLHFDYQYTPPASGQVILWKRKGV